MLTELRVERRGPVGRARHLHTGSAAAGLGRVYSSGEPGDDGAEHDRAAGRCRGRCWRARRSRWPGRRCHRSRNARPRVCWRLGHQRLNAEKWVLTAVPPRAIIVWVVSCHLVSAVLSVSLATALLTRPLITENEVAACRSPASTMPAGRLTLGNSSNRGCLSSVGISRRKAMQRTSSLE